MSHYEPQLLSLQPLLSHYRVLRTRTIATARPEESTGTADTFAGVRGLRRPLVCPTFTLAAVLATTTATVIAATTATVIATTTDECHYGATRRLGLARLRSFMSALSPKADIRSRSRMSATAKSEHCASKERPPRGDLSKFNLRVLRAEAVSSICGVV